MEPSIALITGGSSGIGAEFARQLAEQGNNITIVARSVENMNLVKQDLENNFQIDVNLIVADLGDREGIEIVTSYIQETNNIEYLINNAGFGIPDKFQNISLRRHRDMISVHVNTPTELSYAILPQMQERNSGNIITVSSVAAFIGASLYSGTKRFQVNFTKYLKKMVKEYNINTQVLCPGYVRTNFHNTEDYKSRQVTRTSTVSKWLWLNLESVVNTSLNSLKRNKTIVIPGWQYKLAIQLAKVGLISR